MNRITQHLLTVVMICLFFVLGGCATTESQPDVSAQSSEQGGSWSDVRAVLTGVNLGDVARLAAKVPSDTDDGNGNSGVQLGKATPPVISDALAAGRPVVYLENLTVTQSITTGAKATRAGEMSQAATADTEQTPTNSPTTETTLDLPIIP